MRHQYSELAQRLAAGWEAEGWDGAAFPVVNPAHLQHGRHLNTEVRGKNSEHGINEFFYLVVKAGEENINQALDRSGSM